jgi:hypothetical protein
MDVKCLIVRRPELLQTAICKNIPNIIYINSIVWIVHFARNQAAGPVPE